jgi:hypothetical protein
MSDAGPEDIGWQEKVRKTVRHHYGRGQRVARALAWAVARPRARAPVFVVGCSRGGTTLVYRTLAESRDLGSLERETHEYWSRLHPVEERGWRSHELGPGDVAAGDAASVSRYFFVGTGRRRFVDKNNQNGLAIPYLHALFPDAHFVYVKRSPGDNIGSLMQGWRRAEAFGGWAEHLPVPVAVDGGRHTRWCFFLAPGWEAYTEAPLEEVCAFQYRAMNEAIMNALAEVPAAQRAELAYEDILDDPVGRFREVFQALGVAFDGHLEHHCATVLGRPYNAFSEVRKDKWRDSADAERIARVMPEVEPVARRMGY